MLRFLVLLLFSATAFADISAEWQVTQTPTSTTFAGESAAEAAERCQKSVPVTVPARTVYTCSAPVYVATVTPVATPTCTAVKPSDSTRSNNCPTGLLGSWTQTNSYVEAPYPTCWVQGAWLPAVPPDGACKEPLPGPTTALFSDGFTSGAKSAAKNGVGWLGRGESISIVPYASSPTAYAMRFRYAGVSSGNDGWAEQRFTLPELKELWAEIVIDIPANYVHRNDVSTDNNKLFRIWNGDLADGNDGYSKYAIKGGFSLLPATGGSSVIVEWGRTGEGVGPNSTGSVPLITSADRGKRITLVVHAKTDTSGPVGGKMASSGGNGVLELYKDGKKVTGQTKLSWRSINGQRESFARGYLLGWANSGYSATTDFHVVRFTVHKSNVFGVQ
jgi:hypothetical protein